MATNALDFLLNLRANTAGFNQGIDGAKFAVNALVSALAAVGVGLGVREIAEAADSYAVLSAKIQQTTKDGGDFNHAMAGIHQIALATNSNLDATAGLFTRLNTVAKDMGKSQQFALDMTSTVTKAIQLGGSSAQESEGAVTQFIQAMQGGVLRGEEFNSIMEGGYGLAEALAKGLGVTTGELRKMAEAGELTAERVLTALEKQKDGVDAQYAELPTTISNALQKIATSWQILIGEMDQANGASATVAQWLSTLADNLDVVQAVLDDIGEGFIWFGDQLKKIDPSTIDALKNAVIQAYDTIKTLFSTIGGIGESVVGAINATANAFNPMIDSFIYGSKEVSGFTKIFDGLRIVLALISDGLLGINIAFKTVLAGVQFLGAGILSLRAKFIGLVSDNWAAQVQAQSDALFSQAEKNAKEANRLALESKSATVAAIEDIRKTEDQKNAERIANNEKTLVELKAQEEKHRADYKAISDERIKLSQQLVDARKAGNQEAIDAALAGLAELDKKEKEYQAESKKISDAKVKAAQDWADAQIDAATKGGIALGEQTKKTIEAQVAAQGLVVEFDNVGKATVKAMVAATEATASLEGKLAAGRKGAVALGLDLDVALNRVSDGFAAKQTALTNFVDSLDLMGVKGKQAADVTYQAWVKWLETAKSQAEIDVAVTKLQEFGDKGVISTKQVELGMMAIKQQVQKLPDELDEVGKAFERLGIKTKEQLKLAAQSAQADYQTIKESGQATAEGLQEAFKKYADAAMAANGGVANSTLQAEAQSLGLAIQTDKTGKSTVTSMAEAEEATKKLAKAAGQDAVKAYQDMGDAAEDAGEKAAKAAEDAAKAQSKAMTDFLNSNAAAISNKANDYQKTLEDLGVSAGMAAKYAQEQYRHMWKEFGALMGGGIVAASKTANQAMAEHVEQLERAAKTRERLAESAERYNAKLQRARDLMQAAQDDAQSFMGSVKSIQEEYLKATGQEDKLLQMRYTQRKQQLNLEYELLKVSIQKAKVEAQAAKLDTKPLDQALAEATKGFAEAKKQLAELEKMEKAKLEEQKKVDAAKKAEDAKKVADTAQSSTTDAVKPKNPNAATPYTELQPPNINMPVPDFDIPVSKNVRIELNLGGQSVDVYADQNSASMLEAMMKDLERYAKAR